MKIALAQINTTVGDLEGNRALILGFYREASRKGVDLVVFPELAVTGYPPRDLLESHAFVGEADEVQESLAHDIGYPWVIVGGIVRNPGEGKPLYNAALVLGDGRVQDVVCKTLLPTYDVFDETRYFEPATGSQPVVICGRKVAVTICEDVWFEAAQPSRRLYHVDPVARVMQDGADLLVNVSASPYHVGKIVARHDQLAEIARRHKVAVAHVNLVGGNDDLIFDGSSVVLSAGGGHAAAAPSFQNSLLVADLDNLEPVDLEAEVLPASEVLDALVLGVRDYCRKTGFDRAVVGLSGGIDSSLVATIAVMALRAERVLGVLMPSPYTSKVSMEDATRLARGLGIHHEVIPIEPLMKEYERTLSDLFSKKTPDVTEENIQARIRGNILMALSNKLGFLPLATGNKSELAMGYCTLYGDLAGGLAVISDVPKTMVYEIATEAVTRQPGIPPRVFEKAPSAELRPDQKDEDSLPPYARLDPILHLLIEQGLSPDDVAGELEEPLDLVQSVARRVMANEYKRRQAPIGLKVTSRAFGGGRRYPVAHRYGV